VPHGFTRAIGEQARAFDVPGATSTYAFDGTWLSTVDAPPNEVGSVKLVLAAGGTATATVAFTTLGGGSCTGSLDYAGLTWSANDTTTGAGGGSSAGGTVYTRQP
jgi:hypothetical protein